MVTTRIDIKINGNGKPYEGEPSVELVRHGKWEIDKVTGKSLCRVNVDATVEDNDKLHLDFIPDDPFVYRLLDTFCEAEYLNDEFVFKHPTLSEKRPPQLELKLRFLQDILNRWKGKLNKLNNPAMF